MGRTGCGGNVKGGKGDGSGCEYERTPTTGSVRIGFGGGGGRQQ